MTVRIWDNAYYRADAAAFEVIAGYLNSQGAFHAWTDVEEWAAARATGRALLGIVFWGHPPDDAVSQARGRGCDAVVLDIEGQFTDAAIASGSPQGFGDRCRALGYPSIIYGTAALVGAVGGHYDGRWIYWLGGQPPVPGPRTAYQWNHQPTFDESIADDWFAFGRNRMQVQEIAGVLVAAAAGAQPDVTDKVWFDGLVLAVSAGTVDLHGAVNQVKAKYPPVAVTGPAGPAGPAGPPGPPGVATNVVPHTHSVGTTGTATP